MEIPMDIIHTWVFPQVNRDVIRRLSVTENAWRHIAVAGENAHVANIKEPWGEWLGQELKSALFQCWNSDAVEATTRVEILKQASKALTPELEKCVSAPVM